MNNDDYKRYIIHMIKNINDINILKLLYELVSKYYNR